MKTILKAFADGLALVLILPCWLGLWLSSLWLGRDRAFPGWSQALSLLPGLCGVYLRRAFYRLVLPRCGPDTCLCFGVIFSHPTAQIGRAVYVGPFGCLGDVTLEDDVLLGSHVSIMNGGAQHGIDRLDIPVREQAGTFRARDDRLRYLDRRPRYRDGRRGQALRDRAGSVVKDPIPDYAIAVGVPARVVGSRRQTETVQRVVATQA